MILHPLQAALSQDTGGSPMEEIFGLTTALLELYSALCTAAEGDAASGAELLRHLLGAPGASSAAERHARRVFSEEGARASLRPGSSR